MSRLLRASASSGTIAVVLFFVVAAARNRESIEVTPDLLVGVLAAAVLLWIVGTLFAAVSLIALKPIADHSRPWLSLPAFLIVGFGVPAWLVYQSLHIGQHGDLPPIATKGLLDLSLTVASAGLVGLGSALAAWFSIRKSARSTASTNGAEHA
jgi:hypothetical protein